MGIFTIAYMIINQAFFVNLLILIPASIWLLFLTIGVSLLTSSLNVFTRDISYLIKPLNRILFYATPIIYPLDIIPPQYHILFALNPLTMIFKLVQQSLFNSTQIMVSFYILSISIGILVFAAGIHL